jgi:hypothetical protein
LSLSGLNNLKLTLKYYQRIGVLTLKDLCQIFHGCQTHPLRSIFNTFQAMTETQPNVYETCDPTYLHQMREKVGMDVVQLARIACLSVAQVNSLETGGDDLFYSLAIKRQAYKRTLMILGAPPPSTFALSEVMQDPAPVTVAPVNESLNDIADLTTQPVDDWAPPVRAGLRMSSQRIVFMALAAVVALGGIFAFYPAEGDASLTLASVASNTTLDQPPLATADKPAQMASATLPPVALAPETVKPASAITTVVNSSTGACAFSSDPGPEVSAASPKKDGKFVYVLSPSDTSLCVVDGNKQASTLQLKAGEGRSVYGAAPWQISGNNLAQIQIYFQGWRASLPEGAVQKIVLVEKALTP